MLLYILTTLGGASSGSFSSSGVSVSVSVTTMSAAPPSATRDTSCGVPLAGNDYNLVLDL